MNELLDEQKAIYYGKIVSAWIENRMLKDKCILLVSILTCVGICFFLGDIISLFQKIILAITIISSLTSILMTLSIFEGNAHYLELILKSYLTKKEDVDKIRESDALLLVATKVADAGCIIGIAGFGTLLFSLVA